MKNKLDLNEIEICNEYQNTNIGIESLALKYHVGKKKINEILNKNNISRKKRGGQNSKETFVVSDWNIPKYPENKEYYYLVYDPKTDFVSKDINNKGGVLTTYIKNQYNVPTPTLYDRRLYYMRTGDYWWEQWLLVKTIKKGETKKCPFCDWETTDIHNKSGAFEVHLMKAHGMTKLEYLSKYPEEKPYFALVNKSLDRQMETNEKKFITCKLCGRKLAKVSGTHLRKVHNMSRQEYIDKFGIDSLYSEECKEALHLAGVKANMNSTPKFHSNIENEIKSFIESLGFETVCDRKILKGKEIDILIPSLSIAFEIDGLRWHNEISKDKDYHLQKTKECAYNGITLYHIFEDEWEFKSDIVKSRIRNILGKTEDIIYARKCEIRVLDFKTTELFLNNNHIQGMCVSKINYGLYYNNDLVSVMTFGNPRKNLNGRNDNTNAYELLRFCNKLNTSVVGGASKLFKHFIKEFQPDSIISYADKRWSNGNLYNKLGFSHLHDSEPNYFFIVGHNRENRFKYRKDVLVKEGFDPNKTEHEIMLERGIYRIYDCGSMLFKYTIN